jgi:hypothetical protein
VAREEANENHPAARALRDALGLVRTVYAVTKDKTHRQALDDAGRHLTHAVEQTRKHPGTLGYQTIPVESDWAFGALARVTWSGDIVTLINTARQRVEAAQRLAYDHEVRASRLQKH